MQFDTDFDPAYGTAVAIAEGVVRITAPNPGPFTFRGTNTYLVGTRDLAVIDPGPDDDRHLSALLRAIGPRRVTHVFVSHTHKDHSALVPKFVARTSAETVALGPHRLSRPLYPGEVNPLGYNADADFLPDMIAADGSVIEGDGWALETVATPGHTANHAAFALRGTGVLFSADHVMGWSSSVVAPPEGAMGDYLASIDKLLERDDTRLLPGHGGDVRDPRALLRDLRAHRMAREEAVLRRVRAGDRSVDAIVGEIYQDLGAGLRPAAAMSTLAHLEELVRRGEIVADREPSLGAVFAPA